MKKLVTILAVVLLATASFADVGDPNFTKTYETSKGVITFNHYAHSVNMEDCAFCHGVLEQFDNVVSKDFGHKGCKACHKRVNDNEGANAPTKCSGCHVK